MPRRQVKKEKMNQPGVCRICGCTEYKRCRYLPRPGVPLGSQPVMTCKLNRLLDAPQTGGPMLAPMIKIIVIVLGIRMLVHFRKAKKEAKKEAK